MTDDAFKVESGKTNVSLAIASVRGQAASFQAHWLGARKHKRQSCPEEGKTDGFPEAREEAREDWHKLLDDASTKEAVADDTANSNTNVTSCVNQTTLSDFSKNLEEPSPTENEEEIDDQTRSMDSHEIQCEKECWSDLRADTGTLFFPDKIVMEQHSLALSESILEQGDKELWIRRVSWRFDQ